MGGGGRKKTNLPSFLKHIIFSKVQSQKKKKKKKKKKIQTPGPRGGGGGGGGEKNDYFCALFYEHYHLFNSTQAAEETVFRKHKVYNALL